MNKADSV